MNDRDVAAIRKYLSDDHWRLNHLYWIQDKNGKKVKFRMNAVQEDFYWNQWHLNVVAKSRQHGLSTLVAMMMLDFVLFNSDKNAGIVDRTDLDGAKKLAKCKFAYEHLDDADDPETCALGALIKQGITIKRSNDHEMTFSNNSTIWTSPSIRGGTTQMLHISELGPIALERPAAALEIKAGSMNTVHAGNRIIIESTHTGGQSGMFYDFVRLGQKYPGDAKASALDWKLFFYGWHWDKANTLELNMRKIYTAREEEYFNGLKKEGIELTEGQKFWWSKKSETQGDKMTCEYPATLEEMLSSTLVGSIHGPVLSEIRNRETPQIVDFDLPDVPHLYTGWDIGQVDLTCIWLIALSGPWAYLVDYYSSCYKGGEDYVMQIRRWERQYGKDIRWNYLPHDCESGEGKSHGPSWKKELMRYGLDNIVKVPKPADSWVGIRQTTKFLKKCFIHATNCGRAQEEVEKIVVPSGLDALEKYRCKEVAGTSGKELQTKPVHDIYSHGADALRTFVEAMYGGMVMDKSAITESAKSFHKQRYIEPYSEDGELPTRTIMKIHSNVRSPRNVRIYRQ